MTGSSSPPACARTGAFSIYTKTHREGARRDPRGDTLTPHTHINVFVAACKVNEINTCIFHLHKTFISYVRLNTFIPCGKGVVVVGAALGVVGGLAEWHLSRFTSPPQLMFVVGLRGGTRMGASLRGSSSSGHRGAHGIGGSRQDRGAGERTQGSRGWQGRDTSDHAGCADSRVPTGQGG